MAYSMHNDLFRRIQKLLLRITPNNIAFPYYLGDGELLDGIFQTLQIRDKLKTLLCRVTSWLFKLLHYDYTTLTLGSDSGRYAN